jgi:predicted dienelactone hydrolase
MSESYEPFSRGPFPVGVRSFAIVRGERRPQVELWYPADDSFAGADVDPARRDMFQMMPGVPVTPQAAVRDAAVRPGARWPLVVFSHGLGGHRRQSTFLCTHLASRGYVVAAPDHPGTMFLDAIGVFTGAGKRDDSGARMRAWVESGIAVRPGDLSATIDALLGGAVAALAGRVDAGAIGLAGHSFGGWSALTATARDARVRAVVALAPAGGQGGYGHDPLPAAVELAWSRPVPTLFVVAAADSILPLAMTRELYARTHSPKKLVVIDRADHMHFLDDAKKAHDLFRLMPAAFGPLAGKVSLFADLVPAAPAREAVRGLCLAHFDAHLRGLEPARAWLAGDLVGAIGGRGATVIT